ncbi:GtrA family protein [Gephyromycinifex aptenodytis]|uniref:GtrA family protein n=1 Tax=Gephyromycinifex aptenodytis TaxID=2716227 RepID=UPI001444CF16|nr:GtrA family protein [Gephyromycinifex aptenodytis]
MTGARGSLLDWARHWWHRLVGELAKFGVIGAIAFVVDNGAYAFFQYGWFGPSVGPLYGHEKLASIAGSLVATLVSWIGNRYWTFRDKRATRPARELTLFLIFNAIGALLTMACVAFAIDVLGLSGLAWETTARNIGIVLGTLFRFWTYRSYVFTNELVETQPDAAAPAAGADTPQAPAGDPPAPRPTP